MPNIKVEYSYGGHDFQKVSTRVDHYLDEVNEIAYSYETFKIRLSLDQGEDINSAVEYRINKQWDFGDGTIIYAESTEHSYKQPGRYKITCQPYNLKDGSPTEEIYTTYITVKEAFASNIKLVKEDKKFYISKNNKIGQLYTNVSNYFINKPRVLAYVVNTNDFKDESGILASYWNYRKAPYYHLKRYFCFLEEDNGENTNEKLIYSLKPVEYYTPKYYYVYGYHYIEDTTKKLKLYILLDSGDDLTSDELEKIKENLYCVNEIENTELIDGNNITIEKIYSIQNLEQHTAYLGMVSKTDIWFKNDIDIQKINQLAFEFYENDMFINGEENLEDSYLNFKTTFAEIDLEKPDNSLLIKGLSLNGLISLEKDKEDVTQIYVLDEHIEKNLYKNKIVDIYQAYYIENDPLIKRATNNKEIITYSLYKGTEENGLSKLFFKESNNADTWVDIEIKDDDIKNNNYYKVYTNINPTKNYFQITNSEGEEIYKNDRKLIDLKELIIPSEHKLDIDVERLLTAYMGHPMYENTINLKTMLFDILSSNDNLEYIMRRSEHFVDDNINYKTCYISNLIDILTMFDEEVNDYNINSFNNLNNFKELLRILTMSHSDLFGKLVQTYDIKISPTYKGKNVSDLISYNDEIICDTNYDIIAICKNDKIYPLKDKTPFIICQDNKSFSTSLLSFYNINSYNTSEKLEDLKKLFGEEQTFNIYKLKEYDKDWDWNLILPAESYDYNSKESVLEQFYNFYLFNPNYKIERNNNFIDETTIPLDETGKTIGVEEWDAVGYDCLMKLLAENVLEA